jgi:CheY-like chemotaxis protein
MEAAIAVMDAAETIDAVEEVDLGEMEVADDRESISLGARVLLIVDNDISFAQFLLESAQSRGFKGLITASGAKAIAMAREYQPHAITLDISLPDIDGWRVLDRLKNDPLTRHIPISIISTEDQLDRSVRLGAIGYLCKPIRTQEILVDALDELRDFVDRPTRQLVLIHRDAARREELKGLIQNDDLSIETFASRQEAMRFMDDRDVDCVVLQDGAADVTLSEFSEQLSLGWRSRHIPCIVFVDDIGLSDPAELARIERNPSLSSARSGEHLVDLTSLYLHRRISRLPESQKSLLVRLQDDNAVLAGKTVLIVDDDIRNIFALTSVLERYDMVIVAAETGRAAVNILQANSEIDVVLMDIMMPEMDGMDTMREIRRIPRFKHLPIIAVTAKAMKGDREKCIEAGAWDYLSKPVDTEQLLAVLRAWLHR